jgi:circadian clock protein KaiC
MHPRLLASGVPNLDTVLGGGIRRGSIVLIMGPPGSGKTTLAGQMAFAAARRGQPALVLTVLSEPTTKLIEHWQAYRFFDAEQLGSSIHVLSARQFAEDGPAAAATAITTNARQLGAELVVLDGLAGIRGLRPDAPSMREFLYDVGTTLSLQGATTVITSVAEPRDAARFAEATVADAIVGLHFDIVGVRDRRRLEAVKVRAAAPLPGLHTLQFSDEGAVVYPRLETRVGRELRGTIGVRVDRSPDGVAGHPPGGASTPPTGPAGRSSFGLPQLDQLLEGGLVSETSTLLAGSLGTGKTVIGLHFALAGLRAGEPVVYLSFRESADQLLHKAETFGRGAELRAGIDPGGQLTFLRFAPIELNGDVLADQVLSLLEHTEARRLVIDSILELERAVLDEGPSERVPNYMAALLEAFWQRRVTVLAIKETVGLASSELSLPADPLSILSENVLLVQQLRYRSALHRVLSVVKTRFSAHDPTLREFIIDPSAGVRVLAPVESGVELLAGLCDQGPGLVTEDGQSSSRTTPHDAS